MYNGIGLKTARGSGTNGHVQRNWALVKPPAHRKDDAYRSEDNLAALEASHNKQPNKEILDHERKRRIELKCTEFADILESQGYSEAVIEAKVNNYRNMLITNDAKGEKIVDQWGKVNVTETHQLAEAQKEKNARLREAFGISEYFVDGSSFDPDRQAKEEVAKSNAIQEKQAVLDKEKRKALEKEQAARYELVRTPSPPRKDGDAKKNKKRKNSSGDEVSVSKKKKKSKKRKR